jgi:hypothetical protein
VSEPSPIPCIFRLSLPLTAMYSKAALFQALAAASSFLLTYALPPTPPVPRDYAAGARVRAQVVYTCTAPNTVALTFVSTHVYYSICCDSYEPG